MDPKYFTKFFASLGFALTFLSNFYFWSNVGYFNNDALLEPFLHTWSLSIEAQFYFIIPIYLLLIRKNLIEITIICTATFFLITLFFSTAYPSAIFYLLPARIWEFLIGSLLSVINIRNKFFSNVFLKNLSFTGVVILFFSICLYEYYLFSRFLLIALTCLSIFLIILFRYKYSITNQLLKVSVLNKIGLISYSLFVLHWPVIAYFNYFLPIITYNQNLIFLIKVSLIFILLILATFMWRFIEEPFRAKRGIDLKIYFFKVAFLVILFYLLFFLYYISNKFQNKSPSNALTYNSDAVTELVDLNGEECFDKINNFCVFGEGKNWIHLLGDSHMKSLSPEIINKYSKAYQISYLSSGECLPVLETQKYSDKSLSIIDKNCNISSQNRRLEFIRSHPGIVIISSRYPLYFSGVPFNNLEGGIENSSIRPFVPLNQNSIQQNFLNYLSKLTDYGNLVILIGPIPEVGFNVPNRLRILNNLNISKNSKLLTTNYNVIKLRNNETNNIFQKITDQNVKIIDVSKLFCGNLYTDRCITSIESNSLYEDDNHLNSLGSKLILPDIIKIIKNYEYDKQIYN